MDPLQDSVRNTDPPSFGRGNAIYLSLSAVRELFIIDLLCLWHDSSNTKQSNHKQMTVDLCFTLNLEVDPWTAWPIWR